MADVLRQRIADGGFPERLLDERTLGEELGASRNAVREAMGLLRDEGLIVRRRGVGTTVTTPTYGHGLDRLAGLAEVLSGHGAVANEVLVAEVIEPPATVGERLRLGPGENVVHIERVRHVGGAPLSLDSTFLTVEVGRGVLKGDLETRDIFALIEETTGRPLGRAEIEVAAANADPDAAGMLQIPPGTAIFTIRRLTRLSDGRPVDDEVLRIRADRMTLNATLHRGGVPAD